MLPIVTPDDAPQSYVMGVGLQVFKGVGGFTLASLFDGGYAGFIYSPFSAAYTFTDTARTIPVASGGDLAAGLTDRSGGGNHGQQASGSLKGVWQPNGGKPYLSFDGVDDRYATGVLPTADLTIACAFRSEALGGAVIGGGNSGTNQRAFLQIDGTGRLAGGYGAGSGATYLINGSIAGLDVVGIISANASNVSMWKDGLKTAFGAPTGSPAGSAYGYLLGAYAGGGTPLAFFGGRIYSALVINRVITDAEAQQITIAMRNTYQ